MTARPDTGAGGRPHVVVVGGGLAGLGAALDCADAGAQVTVLERRRRLGGLTWSFEHQGRWIDNGQHVFLRCCRAYLEFLDRIGSAGDVELQERLDLTIVRAADDQRPPRQGRLRRSDLPAPLHLGRALLGYRHLSVADRMRIGLAALPLRHIDLSDPALDDETFGAWLVRHGQRPAAITALWDLITVATINLPASEASLAMGAKVFQTGLLTDGRAADIGWSRIPLGQLHGERALAALGKARVEVRFGAPVTGIETLERGGSPLLVRTVTTDVAADAVIVALPHTELAGVLPERAASGLGRLDGLGLSPIVDVHLLYDRPVTNLPFLAALDSPVQWVFDRSASSGMSQEASAGTAGKPGGQQYLALSLSAAGEHLGTRPETLATQMAEEMQRILPATRVATVLDAVVTKERTATFRATPGSGRLRPGPSTAVPGLCLAGAWTDTGWPATMEGALRSGRRAARAALTAAGITRDLPKEMA